MCKTERAAVCMYEWQLQDKRKEGIYTGDWLTALLIVTQPWLVKSAADERSCSEKQSISVYRRLSMHAHRQSVSTEHEKMPVERASYVFEIAVLLIFASPGRTAVVYIFTVGAQQANREQIISRYKMNVQCRKKIQTMTCF